MDLCNCGKEKFEHFAICTDCSRKARREYMKDYWAEVTKNGMVYPTGGIDDMLYYWGPPWDEMGY